MRTQYKPGYENINHNLMFDKKYPMRGGKFPKDHPFVDNVEPFTFGQPSTDKGDRLSQFRAAGYWASCFPEGDGITFRPLKGQNHDQIIKDIIELLKVEVFEIKQKI